jgi:hypothetical protein
MLCTEREPHLSLEQAFSKLMSTAGLSVFVTLMASCLAFALGSVDDLNSVKWFSAFATLNTVSEVSVQGIQATPLSCSHHIPLHISFKCTPFP